MSIISFYIRGQYNLKATAIQYFKGRSECLLIVFLLIGLKNVNCNKLLIDSLIDHHDKDIFLKMTAI